MCLKGNQSSLKIVTIIFQCIYSNVYTYCMYTWNNWDNNRGLYGLMGIDGYRWFHMKEWSKQQSIVDLSSTNMSMRSCTNRMEKSFDNAGGWSTTQEWNASKQKQQTCFDQQTTEVPFETLVWRATDCQSTIPCKQPLKLDVGSKHKQSLIIWGISLINHGF